MTIDVETGAAISRVANSHGMEAAALAAFVETESGGVAYELHDGRKEPLIRWECHYFDRLCASTVRDKARAMGLSNPKALAVANPKSQQDRWDKLLKPAMELDKQAALESCSWGLGQVMGANWKMLGFASVLELVDTARSGVEGQIELIARFIDKTGLKGALARHDWATVARGYNGPAYKTNRYDEKMAAAYARHVGAPADTSVKHIQERLVAHGFPVTVDGIRGPNTDAAIRAFQESHGLKPDGIVGRFTMAALNETP